MTLDALTRTACEAMLATVLWKQYQGSADRMCYLAGLLQQSRFNDSSSISSHQRCMKWRVSGSLHSTSTAYSRSLGPLTAPAVVWTGCTGGTPAIIIRQSNASGLLLCTTCTSCAFCTLPCAPPATGSITFPVAAVCLRRLQKIFKGRVVKIISKHPKICSSVSSVF